MRNLAGLAFALVAAWFVWAGLQRRRKAMALTAAGAEASARHPSLALLGEIGPSIVNVMLVIAAIQVAVAFLVSDGGGIFSVFDLAGFLSMLAGYGFWVTMKSRHRV